MKEIIIGGCIGILGTLLGVIISHVLTIHHDKNKKTDEILFNVYMKLHDIHGDYFWISAEDCGQSKVGQEIRDRLRKTSWQIADELRKIDDLPIIEDILCVLMAIDPDKYPNTLERYKQIDLVIDKLSNYINPNYQRIIENISNKNILIQGSYSNINKLKNATGSF